MNTIVGIDNFNSYYSVALKRKRALNVNRLTNVDIIDGDICDTSLLKSLFEQYNFTHVINLAAQPGIRVKNPMVYIRNNVECFTVLLEQIRLSGQANPIAKLLYASSSSVYGLNTKIPYR